MSTFAIHSIARTAGLSSDDGSDSITRFNWLTMESKLADDGAPAKGLDETGSNGGCDGRRDGDNH